MTIQLLALMDIDRLTPYCRGARGKRQEAKVLLEEGLSLPLDF